MTVENRPARDTGYCMHQSREVMSYGYLSRHLLLFALCDQQRSASCTGIHEELHGHPGLPSVATVRAGSFHVTVLRHFYDLDSSLIVDDRIIWGYLRGVKHCCLRIELPLVVRSERK